MVIIEYSEAGECISDFDIGAFVKRVADAPDGMTFQVSNGTAIHAVRLSIVSGGLNHKAVYFGYDDKEFQANEYGAVPSWPYGWADLECRISEDILLAASRRRKGLEAKPRQPYVRTFEDTWNGW
jgi:hypothetical protein